MERIEDGQGGLHHKKVYVSVMEEVWNDVKGEPI